MNYNIIQSFEPPRLAGRALVTSWPNSMADDLLEKAAASVNGTVFVVQKRLWKKPKSTAVIALEGLFPKDIEGSHDQFSAVFSPPEHDETHSELVTRVMAAYKYLAPNGFLMLDVSKDLVVPNARIWAGRFFQMLRGVQVLDNSNKTLTVTGFKRGGGSREDAQALSARDFLKYAMNNTFPSAGRSFRIPLPPAPDSGSRLFFRSKTVDSQALADKAASLPWDLRKLGVDLFGWQRPPVFPAMALRSKLYGALMASGVLGSMRLKSPLSGHDCVVRGDTRRVEQERSKDDEKQQIGCFESCISVLDIETGGLTTYDPQKAGQVRVFLEEWAEPLADNLQNAFPVAYDPIEAPYTDVLIPKLRAVVDRKFFGRGVRNLSSDSEPSLTISQRHVTTALLIKALGRRAVHPEAHQYQDLPPKGNHAVVLSGDPGSGKTYTSIRFLEGLTREYGMRRGCSIHTGGWPLSAVVTPPANIPGYEQSFHDASPFFAVRIVERIDDLHRVMKEIKTSPVPIVMLISRTRLRQSQNIEALYALDDPPFVSARYGRLKVNIVCPICGSAVKAPCVASDESKIHEAVESTLLDRVSLRGKNCNLCSAPLWQEKDNGGLYSLAKAMKVFADKLEIDLLGLVLDEVHEDASPDSKQGQAMGWLSDIFAKVLGMSGTFYGGMASSNFHIFFRLFKWFRSNWHIQDASSFTKHYGNYRRTWKNNESGWGARVELPGVSPELISNYLINDLVYMSLSEAGFDLVPRQDFPVLVEPTHQEAAALSQLLNDVKASLQTKGSAHEKKVSVTGANLTKLYLMPSGLHLEQFAHYSHAFVCSLCGEPKQSCEHVWPVENDEGEDALVEPRALPVLRPDFISTKELALIDLVSRERDQGRSCLIYVYHTGKYALDDRLEYLLTRQNIRVLNASTIRPTKLEHEINLSVNTGTDAVIVNPKRAGTGLNLVGTPTVIFYQPVWSVLTTMQGAARSHRPTQEKSVRVYYMVTRGSVEEVILGRVTERMAAIFLASGGDNEGMAAVFDAVGHEESLTELLVNYVSKNVSYDLTSVFAELNSAQAEAVPTRREASRAVCKPVDKHVQLDLSGASQMTLFG